MRKLPWLILVSAILAYYPDAMGQESVRAAPHHAANVSYLPTPGIDLTRLLPPPPAPGSPEEKRDIAAVLAAQEARTAARTELAVADGSINLSRFAGVLGPKFKIESLPNTSRFFSNVMRSSGRAMTLTKDCWVRARPFEMNKAIQPPASLKSDLRLATNTRRFDVPLEPGSPCIATVNQPPEYVYSYPSGHATWGTMTAILLAEMVPEKRAELYARGWEFGESRVIGGVHFPTDVEAGRIQATVLIGLMMLNAQFKADLREARNELREALGLIP